MPYYRGRRRYYRGRRRYGRRRMARAASPTYGQIFSKVVKDVGYLKGLVNSEFKVHNTSNNINALDTGTVRQLTTISQGDDYSQRDGRQVRLKSLALSGQIDWNASATGPQTVRVIIFGAKNIDGTLPSLSDLLSSVDVKSFRSQPTRS